MWRFGGNKTKKVNNWRGRERKKWRIRSKKRKSGELERKKKSGELEGRRQQHKKWRNGGEKKTKVENWKGEKKRVENWRKKEEKGKQLGTKCCLEMFCCSSRQTLTGHLSQIWRQDKTDRVWNV